MAAICHLVVDYKARANYVPFPVRGRPFDVIAEEAIRVGSQMLTSDDYLKLSQHDVDQTYIQTDRHTFIIIL